MPSTPLASTMMPKGVGMGERKTKFQLVGTTLLRGEVGALDLTQAAADGSQRPGVSRWQYLESGENTVWSTVGLVSEHAANAASGLDEVVPCVLAAEDIVGVGEMFLWSPVVQVFTVSPRSPGTFVPGAMWRTRDGAKDLGSDESGLGALETLRRVAMGHEAQAGAIGVPTLIYAWFDGWNGFPGSANNAAPMA